ncbi:MAG: hypothetical protein ACFB4I_15680 [Cyanophyceae cyanobacterium]
MEDNAINQTSNNDVLFNENQFGSSGEPLIVATNTTVKLDSSNSNSQSSADSDAPLAVGTNLTIEISDSNSLLEQLGISTDGFNNYLGSNITTGDDSSWMERQDENPMYGGEPPSLDGEPLLVGTNITFKIVPSDESSSFGGENLVPSNSSDANSGPLVVGTNQTLELTDSDGTLFEQFRISESGSNDYLGNNISTFGNDNGWMTRSEESPSMEGIPMGNVGNAPNNDSNYQWDLGSSGDSMGSGSDLDQLFQASPWGSLSEVGVTSFEQVFPNVPSDVDLSSNPFASGGIPSEAVM